MGFGSQKPHEGGWQGILTTEPLTLPQGHGCPSLATDRPEFLK